MYAVKTNIRVKEIENCQDNIRLTFLYNVSGVVPFYKVLCTSHVNCIAVAGTLVFMTR